MIELTIGMATYQEYKEVYFTLQALRLYQDLDGVELLVVDNYGCNITRKLVEEEVGGRYVLANTIVGTAASREAIFRHAAGSAVLCCDCHVLFTPGAIGRLKQFYRHHPECNDLLQGPLVHDDGISVSTHQEPGWDEMMFGTWATDSRGTNPENEPFEIQMQGLGVFSCRNKVWPGFNAAFRGFGGEEGYLHEKFRRSGGRVLCLPWLRWMHLFHQSEVPYPMTTVDRVRNYVIGHIELGMSLQPIFKHFRDYVDEDIILSIATEVLLSSTTRPPAAQSIRECLSGPSLDLESGIIFGNGNT